MRAVRLGSYSIAATLPGTPNLSRLKSIMRMLRRAPPPRWRTVMRPWLLRPDCCLRGTVSRRSGVFLVISSKVKPVMPRRPGEVGLNCFVGIALDPLENLDRVALGERHNRLLPAPRLGDACAHAALLAAHVHRVDVSNVDLERRLDGVADLRLV